MATLKELRIRINSVKSTQKITKAMKMVAASKLRRAQENAEAARPYSERMERMLQAIANSVAGSESAPPLLAGSGSDHTHLVVVTTSDRGLCGGFNSSIVRAVRGRVAALQGDGKEVKLLCLGRKGRDQLKREFGALIVDTIQEIDKGGLQFDDALDIAGRLRRMFDDGTFDVCSILYNRFKSVISQIVTVQQLVPYGAGGVRAQDDEPSGEVRAIYEYEPDEEEILAALAAAQPGGPGLPGVAGEHGQRAGGADDGDGQRHPQRRRYDRQADAALQPHAPRRPSPRN